MAANKARYFEFCREEYVPLHHQPWWLDAVCGGAAHWQVALAIDKSGHINGALPYFPTRRLGFPVIRLPPLTSYAGPVLQYPKKALAHENNRYSFEKKVFAELIGQLPRVVYFTQNFRPERRNWLPFYWAGFHQTTRYTYTLPDTGDLEGLYAGLKNTVRTDLKTAARTTTVSRENDPALLFRLNGQSLRRKGLRPMPFAPFGRLDTALTERGQSVGFVARDRQNGAPHAGLYLAFDARQAAVLLTGFDPALGGTSRALYGLYWEAIRFCSERGLSLDFEGSMEPGIERVFRAFGGELTPYFQVWKTGSRLLDLAALMLR